MSKEEIGKLADFLDDNSGKYLDCYLYKGDPDADVDYHKLLTLLIKYFEEQS